jgi:aspartate racemase
MKKLGIIGGLSWYSTRLYYSMLNTMISDRTGGKHSPRILLYSVDFHDLKVLQDMDDWPAIGHWLGDIALRLERAGAECILMASNTPHLVADRVEAQITVPLLHIADETAKEINRHKITTAGLIGTKFTMEHPFFRDRLASYGIQTIIPVDADRNLVHQSIFRELTQGVFREETRQIYSDVIDRLRAAGAQGVIFGCTEITLLIGQEHSSIPVFDTAAIHVRAAVEFALQEI